MFFSASLTRASLAKALGRISRIVEKRNTIPILANVLIEADADGLLLRATDLDMEAVERVLATVYAPGALTVPAHLLFDIARKLPDGANISMTAEEGHSPLLIRSGRSRFSLNALPSVDFPELSKGEYTHSFQLKAGDFAKLLNNSSFAMSNEDTRYYLNGVYLHTITEGNALNVRAVATDGHRLARVDNLAPERADGMPGVILPRKAVVELAKLLDGADTVRASISQTKARFEVGPVILTTKLIDGSFPDYQRVIPAGNDKRLVVDKEPFLASVDRILTLSSERGKAVKLALSTNRLEISIINSDSGSAIEELDVEYDSSIFEVGFNGRYLTDVVSQIEGEVVVFKFADPGSPALIADREESGALFVLMPLRV